MDARDRQGNGDHSGRRPGNRVKKQSPQARRKTGTAGPARRAQRTNPGGEPPLFNKRLKRIYLALAGLMIVFIVLFSFLIKGRINHILGMSNDDRRPDYEVFPYHSFQAQAHEEEDDPDGTWPDLEDEEMGNLPPVPGVPAPPAQVPGAVTQATTTSESLTENSIETVTTTESPETESTIEPPAEQDVTQSPDNGEEGDPTPTPDGKGDDDQDDQGPEDENPDTLPEGDGNKDDNPEPPPENEDG